MAVKTENNKLSAYFHAEMVPTLRERGQGKFKLARIPVGMNDRRMSELKTLLDDEFGEHSRTNGRRGSIVAIKDTQEGVINIKLNAETKTVYSRHNDRTRNRVAVAR